MNNQMDFQFYVSLQTMDGDALESRWAGESFDNSWTAAIEYAKEWLKKEPGMKAVVNDRLNRKKPIEILP